MPRTRRSDRLEITNYRLTVHGCSKHTVLGSIMPCKQAVPIKPLYKGRLGPALAGIFLTDQVTQPVLTEADFLACVSAFSLCIQPLQTIS